MVWSRFTSGQPRAPAIRFHVTFLTDIEARSCYHAAYPSEDESMTTDWTLPRIDLDRCNRCGLCVEQCPTSAVEMTPGGPVIARPSDCTYCAACEGVCPQDAIQCPYEIVWAA